MRRQQPVRPSRSRSLIATLCGLTAGVAVAGTILYRDDGGLISPLTVSARECNIKGNISGQSGQKIFHAPGQNDYSDTVIRVEKGERWFCAEAQALAAGWKKAGN